MGLRDTAFYAIPLALASIAAALAWRAYHDGPPEPPDGPGVERSALIDPCAAGHHRCRRGQVSVTTGEASADAAEPCVARVVGKCDRECVADGVTLGGVSDDVARRQLCDAPTDLRALVGDEQSFLGTSIDEAGTCISDGYQPAEDGISQCILRSGVDPNATGVVVSHTKCRTPAVETLDRMPRLITREQAIAIWCARDPMAGNDAGAAPEAGDAGDAATDGDAGDGQADGDARP